MKDSVYLYFGDCVLTRGSFEDISRLGIKPEEGIRRNFYDFDADDDNNPAYLCAEGVIHHRDDGRWVAVVDPDSFRSVPRTEFSK